MNFGQQKRGLLSWIRTSVGLLLVIGLTASCSGFPRIPDYQVVTTPTAIKPTIHQEPSLKVLKAPDPIVITLKDFEFYYQACEDYKSVGEEDAYTLEEVQNLYVGLTQDDACSFAIYGFPVQIWLNFEAQLTEAAGHKQEWVNLARIYAKALMEQYRINKEAADKIENQLTKK